MPFCLNINLLNGLRSPIHSELLDLLKPVAGDKSNFWQLPNNPPLQKKLAIAAGSDLQLLIRPFNV